MGNILKRERSNDRVGLSWLRSVIDLDAASNVQNLGVGKSMHYRHFVVEWTLVDWKITPNLTPELSNALMQWLPQLDTEDAQLWMEMQNEARVLDRRNVQTALLRSLHADILWVRHVYLVQRYPGLADTFVNSLQTSTQWSRMEVKNSRAYGRANFLEIN